MAHLNYFGVENFRVFEGSAKLNLKDITLLIGSNNSGKSSLSKALILYKNVTSMLNNEAILDLGSFDNMVNTNAVENSFTLIFPLTLLNLPFLGQNITVDYKVKYSRIDESNISISTTIEYEGKEITHQDQTDFYLNSENLFSLFQNTNTVNFEIRELGKIERSLFSEVNGSGNYAIIDPSKPSKRYLDARVHGLQSLDLENIPFTELLLSDKKEYLEDILSLYSKKFPSIERKKQPLIYEVHNNLPDGTSYLQSEEYYPNPLDEILSDLGLTEAQCKFISQQVFQGLNNHGGNGFGSINYSESEKKTNPSVSNLIKVRENIDYFDVGFEVAKRIYSLDDHSKVNQLASIFSKNKNRDSKKFVSGWCTKFSIGNEVIIEEDKANYYRTIKLDDTHLIDLGKGTQRLLMLLMQISTAKEKIYIVEEPEAFLHPAFQSKLADLFIDANKVYGHQFIIETHSEYLIRKMQYNVGMDLFDMGKVNIYNFSKNKESLVKEITILENGRLSAPFASGFYDESESIMFALLTKENLN